MRTLVVLFLFFFLFQAEYVKSHHFGGAMVLSLNTDDHKGTCAPPVEVVEQPTKFPLTRKIKQVLFGGQ